MRKENMLTEGPILKGLALFALPILVGQIFQQLYNTADAMIVGQFLSDQEYAAVSSSGSLVFLLIGFFAGISMGAGVVIARYFGAKDWERLHIAIHTTVAFGLIAGVALTAIGMVLTPQILRLMSTPESVMQYSVQYFRMYFAGALGISLYNLLRGILQAVGDS
ncbi:MAG: MATE family efflux transporter, partial [Oscillospiraceae bacterium]|nr:MATE family efflux transporter [Oscillospiraceae bacterium]